MEIWHQITIGHLTYLRFENKPITDENLSEAIWYIMNEHKAKEAIINFRKIK